MTSIFEFLFKYRPYLFEKGTMALRPMWPWYVTVLLAVATLVVAYWVYRRTRRALPMPWRLSLSGLRALAMLVLLFLFLQPVLILRSVIPQKNFVAIAYDLSKSMEIRDGPGGRSRIDVQKELLRPDENPFLDELGRKFKLRYFRFSNAATRVESFEDVPRHGDITDLERTLDQIAGELGSAPVAGIVLVTDGADNRSANLSAAAARLRARNIPVYPVGIGASDFSRDAEVLRVTTPRKVLKDAMVEADVTVRSTGYAGRRAKLVVRERDRVVQSREITLGGDQEVKTHKVSFTSETAGVKVFNFRVEPFQDEVVSENNDQSILLRVEDDRPRILYVEGEPRWVYGFLRRAALEDKNLHLVTLLRQADGKYLRQGVESGEVLAGGFPSEKAELFAYHALVIGSVEASFFTFDQLRLMADFVGHRGGGLLMLGGKSAFGQGGYANTPLEDVLPVVLQAGTGGNVGSFQDVEFQARLTGYGMSHPVTRLSLDETENGKRWNAAPPLVGLNATGGAKPGATILATAATSGARDGSAVLLAFQRFGRGKSMALTTASTWRWRMEIDSQDNFHELFWKQMLRWLVSDVPEPVRLETDRHSYSLEESVLVRAEVSDETFVHLNNAQVTARVKSPSGELITVPLTWDVRREGQYSGYFKPREMGIHEVAAEAFQGSRSLGATTANFRIAESTDEFHNAALNVDLLQRLAAETGGRYYTPRETGALAEDITFVESGASQVEEKELWDMPFLFLILVGAASAEWALRKRRGLA